MLFSEDIAVKYLHWFNIFTVLLSLCILASRHVELVKMYFFGNLLKSPVFLYDDGIM